jgi:hypothetical protein
MDLRARQLERDLRRGARRAIAVSPALTREFERHRPRWWRGQIRLPAWLSGTLFGSLAAVAWLPAMGDADGGPPGLLLLTVWALVLVALESGALARSLFADQRLAALQILPLEDDTVFQIQTRRFWRNALTSVLFHLPAGILLAFQNGPGWPGWLAGLLLPIVQGTLAVALAIHLESFWPRGLYRYLWLLWFPLIVLVFNWEGLARFTRPLLALSWWLPPAGWVNYAYYFGAIKGDPWALALLIPAIIPLWTLPFTWRRLRATYRPPFAFDDDSAEGGTDAEAAPIGSPAETLSPETEAEIAACVRTGSYLRPLPWFSLGWFERLVARCLPARCFCLAEFLTAGRPGWTQAFNKRLRGTAIAALLVIVASWMADWAAAAVAVLALALTLPVFGGVWRGFERHPSGALSSPLFALYPFDYHDLAIVMLLVNSLRCLVATPFVVVLGTLAGAFTDTGWSVGLGVALRAAALALVLQPALVVMRVAQTSGSADRIRLPVVLVLVPLLCLWIGSGVALFLSPSLLVVAGTLAVLALTSLALLGGHRRAWARGRFDLLHATPES